MPGKKKKFIDKKKSVTFTLVHRSQYDPLMANPDAGQRVLKRLGKDDEKMTDEERKDAQRQLGVYYEDDYNYLQHLREARELAEINPDADIFYVPRETDDTKPAIILPSSVFGSRFETEVAMLNKAAPNRDPKIEWDEDIVALLDADGVEEIDPEDELDDDFIEKANAMLSDESDETEGGEKDDEGEGEDAEEGDDEDSASDMEDDDEECDEMPPLEGDFSEMETRSRFTNYSMTSSVIRRNEKLAQLDTHFENVFVQYDDDEIGALDQEELDEGAFKVDSEYFKHIVNEFENKHEKRKREVNEYRGTRPPKSEADAEGGHEDAGDEEEDDDDDGSSSTDGEVVYIEEKPKEQWDCESVLSACSNLYNRPKTIDEPNKPRESSRTKTSSRRGQVAAGTSQTVEKKRLAAPLERKRGETAEEKKARKQSVKVEKRERRVVKKTTKQVFKEEEKRQSQAMLNLKSNLQGIKLG